MAVSGVFNGDWSLGTFSMRVSSANGPTNAVHVTALGLDCLGCHDPHKSTEPGLLHPNVHEPFADRDCSTCHEDGRQPVTDQLSLCLDCHDGLPPLEGEGWVEHAPFVGGECAECHNPHVAAGQHLLASDRVVDTCSKCHDAADLVPDMALAHTPVRDGQCAACHDPHASQHEALLGAAPGETCAGCHAATEAQKSLKLVHKPFAKGQCLNCHTAHGGVAEMNLKREPRELCVRCHRGEMSEAHRGFAVKGTDCAGCHAPHAADDPGLPHPVVHAPFADRACNDCHAGRTAALAKPEKTLCLGCHEGLKEEGAR